MNRGHEVEELRVSDESFLVASTIERCPKTMMIRELITNAIEAAKSAPEDQKLIEISAVDALDNGASKLAIWNTGPAMDDGELREMCDLAASIGKRKSLDENFGMGAKVASLPSNQLGLRYRSCKNGIVSEVILCKRDGVYGRLKRYDEDGIYLGDVIDVTEFAGDEGRSTALDWTEVVLFGNRPEQDTVRDPYDGDPECDRQWLATYLYHRFYRLPDDVTVKLRPGTHKLDGTRPFKPITDRLHMFQRAETVELSNGISIHYLYDPAYDRASSHNNSIKGALGSAVATAAIIYKEEMYDVRKGRSWTLDAPMFGIPFGAKYISVHVELPTGFPVRPESYRQFLRYVGGEQGQAYTTDFAEIVRNNMPDWLVEVIKSYAPSNASTDDEIKSELQRLLNELRVRNRSPRVEKDGAVNVDRAPGRGAEPERGKNGPAGERSPRQRNTDLAIARQGARKARITENAERAPDIIPLREESEISEKEIRGRAARYYFETGQLFLNMNYNAIWEMRDLLEREYANAWDAEVMRRIAHDLAERTMILRVGRAVVYALAKQLNKEWNHDDVGKALAPESLSLAADDYLDALQTSRRKMGKLLRMSRQEVQEELGQSPEPSDQIQ